MRYRVGNIEIDPRTSTVHRAGRELALQPKVFGVLQYLLENRDRVVSKDELLQAVWRGETVHESTIPWSIGHVRDALGQQRGTREPIETVHKRGYRFAANVEIVSLQTVSVTQGTERPGRDSTSAPFVGREAIISRIEDLLEATADRQGKLCILEGAPGLGKTRIIHEIGRAAADRGFAVYAGRLMPDGGGPSFWPFIQILRAMRQSERTVAEPLRVLVQSLEALGQPRAGSEADPSAPLPDERAARFWLVDGVSRYLLGPGSQQAPLLLCIDDLHWADEGTLSLLHFLAPELARSRICILASQRNLAAEGCGSSPLSRLAYDAERIELGALDKQAVGRFIALSAGVAGVPTSLSRAVHQATGGNPLFVQETVRELIRQHGRAQVPGLDPSLVKLPASAKEVLGIGLRDLAPDTRAALDRASVLGCSFDMQTLQALLGVPAHVLAARLEVAQRRGLIDAEGPQRFRFSHALLQELIYDQLPSTQRATWHLAAGEMIEELAKVEPRHAEIAQHYYRALRAMAPGGFARAQAAALRAAQAASHMLEHAEAARFYEWALDAQALDPTLTPRARADLLFITGKAQRFAGQAHRCRTTLERMFELARQHGYADLLLRGARVLRPTFAISVLPDPLVRAALDDVIKLLDTHEAVASDEPNPELARQRVMALSQLACIPPYSGDLAKSKALSEQALNLARSLGSTPELLEALRARLYSLSGPDDTEALLEAADEILKLERKKPTQMTLEAYSARCGALMYRGEQAAADQALLQFSRLAEELQLPEATWYYGRQRAQGYILRGDFDSGIAAIAELYARSQRLGLGYGREFLAALQRRVRHDIRRAPDPALPLEEQSLLAQGALDFIPNTRAQNARYAAERGELAAAQSAVDWLASLGFESIPKEISYLSTLANIAIAVAKLGDLERAEQVYTLLSPYAHHNTPDGYLFDDGAVSHYLALLAATLGWHERVEAHFRSAIVMNRNTGRRPQLARTYYDFAVWTAEQDRQNASAQAQELAHEASILAEAIGMQWLAQLARGLMT